MEIIQFNITFWVYATVMPLGIPNFYNFTFMLPNQSVLFVRVLANSLLFCIMSSDEKPH